MREGGFSILLGTLYGAIGPIPAAGILLNAGLMGLLVVVVSRTAGRLGGERTARLAAIMAVLLPPLGGGPRSFFARRRCGSESPSQPTPRWRWCSTGCHEGRMAWLLVMCLAMLTIRAPVAESSRRPKRVMVRRRPSSSIIPAMFSR